MDTRPGVGRSMALGDFSRINTNTGAMRALGQLNKTAGTLATRQMRLATGSRINSAEDDSAGFSIAAKLQAKTRGQAQALSNIGDAKSLLTVAEGSLTSSMDILQTMKEKAVQAANDTLGTDERTAIQGQLDALALEVMDTLGTAAFNGKSLFSEDGTSFAFQVGAEDGERFTAALDGISAEKLGLITTYSASGDTSAPFTDGVSSFKTDFSGVTAGSVGDYTFAWTSINPAIIGSSDGSATVELRDSDSNLVATQGVTWDKDTYEISGALTYEGMTVDFSKRIDGGGNEVNATTDDLNAIPTGSLSATSSGGLDVSDHDKAGASIGTLDAAISAVSQHLASLGDDQSRLTFKESNLQTSKTNYESARSRIADADFAKEQMEIVKLQILQQTGTSSMAQANSAGQGVLSLL